MAKIVFINGSPNDRSRLNGLRQYASQKLKEKDIIYEEINVHQLPAEDLISANFESVEIKLANKKVVEADGVLIFSPVYKASYSGILKTYLDLIPQKGFENKVIVPFLIGGSLAHLLAIEYALHPVLSALGATTIIKGVYTIDKEIERIAGNQYILQKDVSLRIDKSMEAFLQHLEKIAVLESVTNK